MSDIRKPSWCLIGNISENATHGEGQTIRSGTRHFSVGSRVYCLPWQWGDGFATISVVGHHRGSRQYVSAVIKARWVSNWRARMVHSPELLRRLREHAGYFWKDREQIEKMIALMRAREMLRSSKTEDEFPQYLGMSRK
jgi:hypothetical protein